VITCGSSELARGLGVVSLSDARAKRLVTNGLDLLATSLGEVVAELLRSQPWQLR
jgi:hypothetical protein